MHISEDKFNSLVCNALNYKRAYEYIIGVLRVKGFYRKPVERLYHEHAKK